ncbi:hypothetical protein P3L10_028361 [Capsicum annuum]
MELELYLMFEAGESLQFFSFFTKASLFLSSFTARITYINVSDEEVVMPIVEADVTFGLV